MMLCALLDPFTQTVPCAWNALLPASLALTYFRPSLLLISVTVLISQANFVFPLSVASTALCRNSCGAFIDRACNCLEGLLSSRPKPLQG